MNIRKSLWILLLPGLFLPMTLLSGANEENGKLYSGDIKIGSYHLIGYLHVSSVRHTEQDHASPDHHCPVDSSFIGEYHRVIFGNKSGHSFFDLIVQNDSVIKSYFAPSLNNGNVMRKIEALMLVLISSIESQQPQDRIHYSDASLNLTINFKMVPETESHSLHFP